MKQTKDRRLRYEFALTRSACRWVAAMPWQGRWFELAKAEVVGHVGSQLQKKFLFLPSLEV
jgi:hypothetical protein